jgi:hypothetical protein
MPIVKNLIRDFVTRDVSKAIESYKLAASLKHQGLKGKAREIFVQQLFRPLLSADFGLGSGTITDKYGNQSGETDVVLYCPEIMPPIDAKEPAGYFPIEACIYAFEVKSVVTAAELKDAIKKAQAIDRLESIHFTNRGPASTRPIVTLFGFSSDLKSGPEKEFARFKALIDVAGPNKFGLPSIRVFCVVGKGYWFWNNGWHRLGIETKHAEVLGLVAGVLNSIRAEKQNRYGLPFGHYILDDAPIISGI